MSTPEAVKNSLAQLEQEFSQLQASGDLNDQTVRLFQSMLLLVTTVVMLLVEKKTPKTPLNSSIPSSRSGEDETAKKPAVGSRSKGNRHTHAECDSTRVEVERREVEVTECSRCGADLTEVKVLDHQRRTLVDIVFVTRETHVDAQIKRCPECAATSQGEFPEDMPGPLQYGNGIIAYAVHLIISQMVALRRTAQLLRVMTGRLISEATLLVWVMRVNDALEQWEQAAIDQLLRMPAMHADETSIRVSGKQHWIHSCSAGHLVVKRCHPNRGRKAIDAINIIPRYGGGRSREDEEPDRDADPKDDARPVVVHDRWATYFVYDSCAHALCGSHLLRDLEFIIDAHDCQWAKDMSQLLRDVNREVAKSEDKILSDERFGKVRRQYRKILKQGKTQLPPPPERTAKRGRIPKTKMQNLLEAFEQYETEILRFTRNACVPFTNNAARSIRMSKVKQKVSGTFRSVKFAAAYCRISSYLQTMENLGYNPLTAIQLALKGEAANILRNNG